MINSVIKENRPVSIAEGPVVLQANDLINQPSKFADANSQFTRFQKVSMYLGRALR